MHMVLYICMTSVGVTTGSKYWGTNGILGGWFGCGAEEHPEVTGNVSPEILEGRKC